VLSPKFALASVAYPLVFLTYGTPSSCLHRSFPFCASVKLFANCCKQMDSLEKNVKDLKKVLNELKEPHCFLTSYHHHPAFLPQSSLYPFPLSIPCCNPSSPKIPLFASHKMGGRSESPPPLFSPRPPCFSWANYDNSELFGWSTPPLAHPFTKCEVCFESHSSQCEECCTSLGCCLCLAHPSGTFTVLEQAFYTRLGMSASPLRQQPVSLLPAYPFEPTASTLGSTCPDFYADIPPYQTGYSVGSQISDPELLAPRHPVSAWMEWYYSYGNRGANPL
jgi:hypothetical protein